MDLLDSRKKPEFCDIKIQVFDGEIPVSKLILSIRSEYFRLMFSNNCVESSTGQVNMPYSKDVLEKLLIYLYTGEIVFKDLQLGLLLDLLDLLRMTNLSEEFKHVKSYLVDNIYKKRYSSSECLMMRKTIVSEEGFVDPEESDPDDPDFDNGKEDSDEEISYGEKEESDDQEVRSGRIRKMRMTQMTRRRRGRRWRRRKGSRPSPGLKYS